MCCTPITAGIVFLGALFSDRRLAEGAMEMGQHLKVDYYGGLGGLSNVQGLHFGMKGEAVVRGGWNGTLL